MRYKKFLKEKKSWRNLGVTLCVFIMIAVPVTASLGDTETKTIPDDLIYNKNSLNYTFMFLEPEFHTIAVSDSEYTNIDINGCMPMGKLAGEPMVPVKSVKLMLPPMKTVSNVNVVGDPIEVDLGNIDLNEKPVFPYQDYVPIGNSEPQEFKFDNSIYSSDSLYPSNIFEDYRIGYSHGYAIFDIAFNPIQYIPSEGKIFYYPELTLTIDLEDTQEVDEFFRNNDNDKEWVESIVINPEISEYYTTVIPTVEYPGGLCDPSDNYNYVIITTTHNDLDYWSTGGSLVYNWDDLMDKHESDDGLSCTLVTIQDIDACTDYHSTNPLFNDQEAHIREFCKDAYDDWDTEYVLIGGDAEWIPARLMDTNYETNIEGIYIVLKWFRRSHQNPLHPHICLRDRRPCIVRPKKIHPWSKR